MSMVEPEFALFQVPFEGLFGDAIERRQAAFSQAPKRLNAIHMRLASSQFVVAMIDPKVLVKADVYPPIIPTPAIGMDDTGDVRLAPNNGLQCGFGGIGDDFGVDAIAALEQTKDDGLAIGSPPAFAANPSCAKVRFIGFKRTGQWRALGTPLANAFANTQVNGIDRAHRYTGQSRTFCGRQIQRKMTKNLPKFRFTDFRTSKVSIFRSHNRKLACHKNMFAS